MVGDTSSMDIAIIGSGPAGMTAGLYAARAGYDAVVFESLTPGGQIATTEMLDNYPGFPDGIGGFDFAYACRMQAERFGVRTVNEQVVSVDLQAQPKRIVTPYAEYRARAVIIASGARNRQMGVEGEDALRGRGVSYCATCDGGFFRGKRVLVIGGANTAVEDALYLSRLCERVTIVYRRDRVRATTIYTNAAEAADNIDFKYRSVVEELHEEDGRLSGVTVRDVETGATERLDADAVFVAIGSVPNSEIFEGQLTMDGGYIVAGEDCATGVPGVYVAGDIRTKQLRQVVTAVADGAVASENAAAWLSTGNGL